MGIEDVKVTASGQRRAGQASFDVMVATFFSPFFQERYHLMSVEELVAAYESHDRHSDGTSGAAAAAACADVDYDDGEDAEDEDKVVWWNTCVCVCVCVCVSAST